MKKLIILASLLSTAFAARGEAQAFVRPVVSIIKPASDGYSAKPAGGLCGGIYFGQAKAHELSGEFAYTRWDFSNSIYSSTEEYVPVLFNYRYHFALPSSPDINFYAGPSAGFISSTVTVDAGRYGKATRSDSTFTVGGSAGVQFKISQRLDIDVGYRYLTIKGATYSYSGYSVTMPDTHANALYGSVGFRF